MVPNVNMGIVDVRDVAKAHIQAALLPADKAQGRRFFLYNKSVSMMDMSKMMMKEFPTYKISTTKAPYFLLYLISFFNASAAAILPGWGKVTLVDNEPSRTVLKIDYHPIERTMCDSGHSLIFHGFISKKEGYAPPSTNWTPLSSGA
jgi:nucleoside-diphosphate-sugar epimerase